MFALFAILSVLLHAVILIVLASNAGESERQGMQKDKEVVNVAAVTIPEPPPEEPEAPEPPPPEAPRNIPPPRPEPRKPDPIRNKPIATPKPQVAQATPTPTPLPNTPSASPSAGPPPTPSPTPTPEQIAQAPTEAEVREHREKLARQRVVDAMKQMGNEVPDDYQLPVGYESYEQLLKDLDPEAQAKLAQESKDYWASKFGPINNTGRVEGAPSDPGQPSGDPNATPDPDASVDPNARPGVNLRPHTDPNRDFERNADKSLRRVDKPLDGLPSTNLHPDDLKDALEDEDKLGDFENTDLDVDPNLIPGLGPIKLDYQLSDLGALKAISFTYDDRKFKGQWEAQTNGAKKITVQHYLAKANPNERDQKSFEMDWDPIWDNDMNRLAQDIIRRYLVQKQFGP